MVDFEDFLIGVRGKPNSRRQAIIDKAYLRFDKDGTGYISVKDVRYIVLLICVDLFSTAQSILK